MTLDTVHRCILIGLGVGLLGLMLLPSLAGAPIVLRSGLAWPPRDDLEAGARGA